MPHLWKPDGEEDQTDDLTVFAPETHCDADGTFFQELLLNAQHSAESIHVFEDDFQTAMTDSNMFL